MFKKNFLTVAFFFLMVGKLIAQQTNPIVIGRVRFTVITPELIRMEYATDSNFVDNRTLFANNRNVLTNDFKLARSGKNYTITTKRMELHFTDWGGPFSNLNIRITVFNKPENYQWRFFSKDDKNLGGPISTLDRLTGSVPTDNGLLSRNGWQIIDDSRKEILKGDWLAERSVNHLQDYYFFAYGNDYKAALKALTTISGEVPMNRKYVHGSWYCRWWDYSADDFLKIVEEYKQHDFPLDVLVMDMGWHTQDDATTGIGNKNLFGWTGYTWNRKLFPDPKGLLAELKKDHLAVTINDHPHDGIRHHEAQYGAFMAAMGVDTANQQELLFNAGSKKYMDNFFKFALKPHEDEGVDFWWLDWQQDVEIPYVLGFHNLRHLPWINYLYFKHSADSNKRGLLFSRWAGWGSHRTPIQFSGDARSTWDMLKFEVPFTANSGNAGCFFWAHDIGGFSGQRDMEQYVRWTQFGLTTSSLRIHSTKNPSLDRRPWLWGKEAEAALKKVYHLRSQLMPYVYSSVWQSHSQSVPLNRGMYIEYPLKEEAYANPQQFLFGDLLLSAPIVNPGNGSDFTSSQKVWFPEGDDWYDIFSARKYEGGTTTEVSADLMSFPLYVKGGFPLPMQPYRQRMATATLDTLILRCYPGILEKKGTFQLYEDDRLSNDYKKGAFAITNLTYLKTKNVTHIDIEPDVNGKYKGQPSHRNYIFQLPGIKILKATVNGKRLITKTDPNTSFNYVEIRNAPIKKTLKILITD